MFTDAAKLTEYCLNMKFEIFLFFGEMALSLCEICSNPIQFFFDAYEDHYYVKLLWPCCKENTADTACGILHVIQYESNFVFGC